MEIKDNKNLKLELPGGSYGEYKDFKKAYSGLDVKDIEREDERRLRLDVADGNNELRLFLRAINEEGEEDLEIIENNKEKLIGKTVDKAIIEEF